MEKALLRNINDNHRSSSVVPVITGICWAAISWGAMILLAYGQLPRGSASHCRGDGVDDCYCEAFACAPGNGIMTPANTWSAMAFTIFGIIMVAPLAYDRSVWLPDDTPRNRFNDGHYHNKSDVSTRWIMVIYALCAIYMGPGSAAFHATMAEVGGFCDTLSMFLWLGFVLAYDCARLFNFQRASSLIPIFIVIVAACVITQFLTGGDITFQVLTGLALGVEFLIFCYSSSPRSWHAYKWFVAALVSFAGAFTIWSLSRSGHVACAPHSWAQGHALWHILSAVTVACIYRYLQLAPDPVWSRFQPVDQYYSEPYQAQYHEAMPSAPSPSSSPEAAAAAMHTQHVEQHTVPVSSSLLPQVTAVPVQQPPAVEEVGEWI